MPLSADQRAMLGLMLERGQGYEDLASLLDLSEAEVRARARAALTELGGADPDRNVGLTDYLLGQADPIGRADAARHLKEDPEDNRLAADLVENLRGIAPGADLPKLPSATGGRFRRRAPAAPEVTPPAPAAPRPKPAAAPSGPGRLAELSAHRSRLMVAVGAGALILVVVVLAIAGVFGGDESSGSTSASATTTTSDESLEQVKLQPSDGGDAAGTATFGIATGDQPFVDVDITKLEQAPQGKAYVLWLLFSDNLGYPLTPLQANPDGTVSTRVPIPAAVTPLAAKTQQVDVSLSEAGPLQKEIRQAASPETQSPVISYVGESILRGDVPASATQQ
jgi:Anti-sigma-K factor rskA